jgi:hypothetical protein
MQDMHSTIFVQKVLGPVVLAADNTPAALDRQGYDAVEILIDVGIGGITFDTTNKIEFKVTHSDDDSTYTNVADADMIGVSSISSGIIKSLIAAHAAAAAYRFGYRGNKRYLKILADFSGTHGTGTPISIDLILGSAFVGALANQA